MKKRFLKADGRFLRLSFRPASIAGTARLGVIASARPDGPALCWLRPSRLDLGVVERPCSLFNEGGSMSLLSSIDVAGRRRSPATTAAYHLGRAPGNKGMSYPADPPRVEEIVAVMCQAGSAFTVTGCGG